MTKAREQSLVMSLSFSWLLRVLVISAVLKQGMTAMWTQTLGCPVTALYHHDERKLTAQVSLPVAPVSILAHVPVKTTGVVMIKNTEKITVLMQNREWERGVINTAPVGNSRTWCSVLGVRIRVSGGADGKASSPTVHVCRFMFLVEWQSTNSSTIWF